MTGTLVMSAAASRRFIWSIVTAQFLVQIGAFSLPALALLTSASWTRRRVMHASRLTMFDRPPKARINCKANWSPAAARASLAPSTSTSRPGVSRLKRRIAKEKTP